MTVSSPAEPDKKQPGKGLKRPSLRSVLIAAAVGAIVLLLIFFLILWYLIASAPDIDSVTVSPEESATYICDQEGNLLRKLTLSSSNRDIVSLDQIPEVLQEAVIAIEDERFYSHGGIDLKGISRALWRGVTRLNFSEGASTITQQLIKNSVFTEWTAESSFWDRFSRKVQEQYLALQLENRMSKDHQSWGRLLRRAGRLSAVFWKKCGGAFPHRSLCPGSDPSKSHRLQSHHQSYVEPGAQGNCPGLYAGTGLYYRI